MNDWLSQLLTRCQHCEALQALHGLLVQAACQVGGSQVAQEAVILTATHQLLRLEGLQLSTLCASGSVSVCVCKYTYKEGGREREGEGV